MLLQRLDDRLSVSDALTAEDLPRLVNAGVRSIIDLRAHGEPRPRGLAPWEEAALAQRAGLVYRQVPVGPPLLNGGLAHAIRRMIAQAAPRVVLHCTTGRRARVFGLLVLAYERSLTAEECLEVGRARGLDFDGMPRLTSFLRHYVERHGRYYRDPAPTTGRSTSDYEI